MHWDAARYDTDFSFVTGYGEELLDLLELQPGARVLDVGCGTGAHAGALAARGYDVLGVDVDKAMLERARTQGYIDNYQGIRISSSGRRFLIEQAIVWNVTDRAGNRRGQAATFSRWTFL